MADLFDVVDVMYSWVKDGSITFYKDKAPSKPDDEAYGIISALKEINFQRTTVIPVNINIYYTKSQNGMIRRSKLKALKDEINQLIEAGTSPGYLFDLTKSDAYVDSTYSNKYDILVMSYELVVTAD